MTDDFFGAARLLLVEARQAKGKKRLQVVRQLRAHLWYMRENTSADPALVGELINEADLLLASLYSRLRSLHADEQAVVCIRLSDLLKTGPAHFREQAEAKLADIFGEQIAAQLVNRQDAGGKP